MIKENTETYFLFLSDIIVAKLQADALEQAKSYYSTLPTDEMNTHILKQTDIMLNKQNENITFWEEEILEGNYTDEIEQLYNQYKQHQNELLQSL